MNKNNKSSFKRNLIWIVILFLMTSFIIYFLVVASNNKSVTDIVKAYSEQELYDDALNLAKKNKTVIEILGKLEPIDKTAILEGTISYSKKYDTVITSVRVIGNKARGRLDIFAIKTNNQWKYNSLRIRIKKPLDKKQTIEILKIE